MKWVLKKAGPKILSPEFMKPEPREKALKPSASIQKLNDSNCFVVEDQKSQVRKRNIWVTYKFKEPLTYKAKASYELYCGGWLAFYDEIVRSEAVNHAIYFQWSKNTITIYISPPCVQAKSKYPKAKAMDPRDLGSGQLSTTELTKDPPQPPPPPPPPM